jgi:tRNA-Thr(GGU) m(6)t(6)A37 methyltransferase TsaA
MQVIEVKPVGVVRSPLNEQRQAPKQGNEGAPDAWIEFDPAVEPALADLQVGDIVLVLTWLDRGDRGTLRVHPRDDPAAPMRGVFSTRSQDRPNPIGLHRVKILQRDGALRLRVSDLEALDGTPVIDVKPVLDSRVER